MNISRQYENIIFDGIIIICATTTLIVSFLTLLLILFCRTIKERDQINNLLTANTFLTLVIIGSFILDMYTYTIYGHLYPNVYFDGWWCKIKSYLYYSSAASFMYSFFLHAIYRFCRVILPMRTAFQSFRLYQFAIIIQWIFCLLFVLILLFLEDIVYVPNDFNCQIELINVRGMLIFIPLGYFIPVSLTTNCYTYTLYYYRKHNGIRSNIRQQVIDRRDMIVLTRIIVTLTFMMIVDLPTILFCIIYYIFGYLPWWSRPVGWLSVALSFAGVSIILIIVSPHLQQLWTRRNRRVHP